MFISLPGIEPGDETGLTAVLTETKACTDEELKRNIGAIEHCLSHFRTLYACTLHRQAEEYSQYWAIRSGIFLP